MGYKIITSMLIDLVNNRRIFDTALWYVLSIITPTDKHSQANAARQSGKDDSLFSNLLSKDPGVSSLALNRASRRALKKLSKRKSALIKGSPWTIAIIIDATLHRRTSRHIDNAQKFNHGQGWVLGHQWTNIGVSIAGQFIPLRPIPFYTKKYCQENQLNYKSEQEKVAQLLSVLSLDSLGLKVSPEEVVVLMDSGYDCKKIERAIISRKWDFIIGLKCSRQISTVKGEYWHRVDDYFGDGRRPWKSIRVKSSRGKQCLHRIKQQVGVLKGVKKTVKLVCSKRSGESKCKHLVCSNPSISAKSIILAYRSRWEIEIFHREVKNYLGLEHAKVSKFTSLINHVHWVYVAYILLKEMSSNESIQSAQLSFQEEARQKEIKFQLQLLTQVGGIKKIKEHYSSVLQGGKALKAA